MTSPLLALFFREWRIARRIGGSGAMGVVFFLTLVTIVPFAVGPDPNLLARIGPAVLWIAALLASLLAFDRLFQADAEDGSLDLLHLGDTPLELAVLIKCAAHWMATGLPLIVAAPFLGLLMALLVLPLTIPVLIFGVSAAEAAAGGTVPFFSPFAILCAITLVAVALCPFAAAAALRHLGE